MGVEYYVVFGIGFEVEINKDKLQDLVDFDDEKPRYGDFHRAFEKLLATHLKDTDFELVCWGDHYDDDEYSYAIILKKELSEIGLNLEPYKTELEKWLAQQEICKPVGEFDLVGGGYVC